MAVEDQVVALLKADAGVAALVNSRVYAMPAPQGTTSPFITYQIIDVQRIGLTYEARATHAVTTLQVDCWADSTMSTNVNSRYDRVIDLARAVRAALDRKGLNGEDTVDVILWTGWRDLNTPTETRRSVDFDLYVKDP